MRCCIDRNHSSISATRQCELLGLSRSSLYYRCRNKNQLRDLDLMKRIDEEYIAFPYHGSRRIAVLLGVNRKRIQRLIRKMGIAAIHPGPNLSKPSKGHKVYPYLLRGYVTVRPNEVWSTDITYLPLNRGFGYLTAVIDWHSRYVLS